MQPRPSLGLIFIIVSKPTAAFLGALSLFIAAPARWFSQKMREKYGRNVGSFE